jgi:hypothetical protein
MIAGQEPQEKRNVQGLDLEIEQGHVLQARTYTPSILCWLKQDINPTQIHMWGNILHLVMGAAEKLLCRRCGDSM